MHSTSHVADIDLPDTRLPQLQKFVHLKTFAFDRYGKGHPDETQAKVKAQLPGWTLSLCRNKRRRNDPRHRHD